MPEIKENVHILRKTLFMMACSFGGFEVVLGSSLEFVNSFCISDLLREAVVLFGAIILEASLEYGSRRVFLFRVL